MYIFPSRDLHDGYSVDQLPAAREKTRYPEQRGGLGDPKLRNDLRQITTFWRSD